MDRIWPTRPPAQSVAAYHTWLDLTFLHWRLPIEQIRPLIPPELTLDTWDGDAMIGLVPFQLRDVRPGRLPVLPGISHFLETNLRTYLPYYWARMTLKSDVDRRHYQSHRLRSRTSVTTDVRVELGDWFAEEGAASGSLEHFLVERYPLYAQARDGRILQGQVYHRPYPLRAVTRVQCQESLSTAAGITLASPPCHAIFSPGVRVQVFGLQEILPVYQS